MALILYRVMRQRLKAAGHNASPESALAKLREIQRQSVAINQGVPVSGISNIHREQADLLAAMNIRKPVPDAQLSLSCPHWSRLNSRLMVFADLTTWP